MLDLLAEGYSQKEIAALLGVDTSVISCRLRCVLRRTGARSLEQLMVMLVRKGVL